jgi:hypothetical protein
VSIGMDCALTAGEESMSCTVEASAMGEQETDSANAATDIIEWQSFAVTVTAGADLLEGQAVATAPPGSGDVASQTGGSGSGSGSSSSGNAAGRNGLSVSAGAAMVGAFVVAML